MASDEKYLFVDEELHMLTGEQAARALEHHSDAAYLDSDNGVVAVPKTRWLEAQRYERDTWLVANAEATDDRNTDHAAGFGGYSALSGRRFKNAIELGCGPFTNLRIVARHCFIQQCSLLDPLIADYLKHPHCTYDRKRLRIDDTQLSRSLGRSVFGRAIRRLLGTTVPASIVKSIRISELLPIPIEELFGHGPYDLCVMINVLEHCYDANAIFEKILSALPPGGLFVFHDKMFDPATVEEDVRTRFDAGHPLRVGSNIIRSFLGTHFTELYRCERIVHDEFEGIDLSREGIYFIGARK